MRNALVLTWPADGVASSWQALRSRLAWLALGIIFEPIHFCDTVKVKQSVSNFAYSRSAVFPAAICVTQKTQREKAASSPARFAACFKR
jgi:hypothetical protein